jgi:hypothetical protein
MSIPSKSLNIPLKTLKNPINSALNPIKQKKTLEPFNIPFSSPQKTLELP